jgi:hypothetical protein
VHYTEVLCEEYIRSKPIITIGKIAINSTGPTHRNDLVH